MTPTLPGPTAKEIVRQSRSNLAFALACLPRRRREDMYVFYAFCRVVDDIADDEGWTVEERSRALDRWRAVVKGEVPAAEMTGIEAEVAELRDRLDIPREELLEIIRGVEMDLAPRRFETWEELKLYCYRVASCVGLVSIRVFGCTHPQSREYALNLGYALQITNILRDIRDDWENGRRVYLPRQEMAEAGYTEEDLAAGRWNEAFLKLASLQVRRAREYYRAAKELRTRQDRRPLLAAEAMRLIYSETLDLLEADGCRVFEKHYRLSTARKLALLTTAWMRGVFGFGGLEEKKASVPA